MKGGVNMEDIYESPDAEVIWYSLGQTTDASGNDYEYGDDELPVIP